MAEICKYGIVEIELVTVTAAVTITAIGIGMLKTWPSQWQVDVSVFPLQAHSHSLQRSVKLPKHSLSSQLSNFTVVCTAWGKHSLLLSFLFVFTSRIGLHLIKLMNIASLWGGWWRGVVALSGARPPQLSIHAVQKEGGYFWGLLTSYCVSPYGAALLNED